MTYFPDSWQTSTIPILRRTARSASQSCMIPGTTGEHMLHIANVPNFCLIVKSQIQSHQIESFDHSPVAKYSPRIAWKCPWFLNWWYIIRYGYEKASERWLPIHTVETILISVISMLAGTKLKLIVVWLSFVCICHYFTLSLSLTMNELIPDPNDESPANVDAAKEWRENYQEFRRKVARCVRRSQEEQ